MAATEPTTEHAFNDAVRKGPVLVKFYASWCHNCKAAEKTFNAVVARYNGCVKAVSVDVEKLDKIADRFRVASIPVFVAMKDGEAVDSLVGAVPAKKLEALVAKIYKA